VRQHQGKFQTIADANKGQRSAETAGYRQSAFYVRDQLKAAGYRVTLQPFEFLKYYEIGPSTFEKTAPPTPVIIFTQGENFDVMTNSDPGEATAAVRAVGDFDEAPNPPDPNKHYGCAAEDFVGFPTGDIALVQRGNCPFWMKATNAATAGAAAVIIIERADNTGLPNGDVGGLYAGGIPVFEATNAVGAQLRPLEGLQMHLKANVFRKHFKSLNVLAETRGGDPKNVVMVGAYLDSFNQGPAKKSPGINSNGSGSAAVLETALQMAKVSPRNKVRFAWWGANEAGYAGSQSYLTSLAPDQLGNIALYLNFETLGSPNYARFIYPGAETIQAVFRDFYTARGLAYKLDDRWYWNQSDYAVFNSYGIGVGGLTTGRDEEKTEEEAAAFGGKAGQAYDYCYHKACDTFQNTETEAGLEVLDQNADAVAYSTLLFSRDTTILNKLKVEQALRAAVAGTLTPSGGNTQ